MSRSSFITWLFLIAIVSLGCSKVTGNFPSFFSKKQQYEKFVSENLTYSLHIPAHWQAKTSLTHGSLLKNDTKQLKCIGNYREMMTIKQAVEPSTNLAKPVSLGNKETVAPKTLNSFSNDYLRRLQNDLETFQIHESGETLVNNYRAKRFVYTYKDDLKYNTGRLKSILYIIDKNGKYYIVTGTDAKEDFKDTRNEFTKIVETLKFI